MVFQQDAQGQNHQPVARGWWDGRANRVVVGPKPEFSGFEDASDVVLVPKFARLWVAL